MRSKSSAVYDFSQENEDGLCLVLFPNNSLSENTDNKRVSKKRERGKLQPKGKKEDLPEIAIKTPCVENIQHDKRKRPHHQRKCVQKRMVEPITVPSLAQTPGIAFNKTVHMDLGTRGKVTTPENLSTKPCKSTPSQNNSASVPSPMLSPVIKLSPINFTSTGTETNTGDASQTEHLDSSCRSISNNSKLP